MSEEILKALMQLFAIIAKQDGVLIEGHEKYVRDFLSAQLSVDRGNEYLEIYLAFLHENKTEPVPTEQKEKSRTLMKDSVRTLAICKKINKTLAQKQKTIVLIRLLEFFKKDLMLSANRNQIIETVAEVFNIGREEYTEIRNFVFEDRQTVSPNEIVVSEKNMAHQKQAHHFIELQNYQDVCKFIYLKSIQLVILKFHGSLELYLNGLVIRPETIYLFPQGSTLRFPQSTLYFSSIINLFTDHGSRPRLSFSAHIREHVFPNGKKALNELRIGEYAGNLIGIMGASGSGKTTLLSLLSGQEIISDGEIRINGKDLKAQKKDLEGVIGFVPQDDLLIEDLSVYENLYYNARLCFRDISEETLSAMLGKTLSALGLDEIKDIKVGSPLNKKISGGQRKRLNIALELIREPHILFLDEPTSGLSSRDSENVMDLLKELSLKGKLIFVVIHQPSSDIFKMFDKILILDTGGYPAYYGNPVEGVMYFKKITHQINSEVGECHACGSVNPETIFNLIELKEIDEYGNYTAKRKTTPLNFYSLYREKFLQNQKITEINASINKLFSVPRKLVQTRYFFLRDLYAKLANRQYLMINLFEVPVLALFLSLIIRYTGRKDDVYTYYDNYNIPAYFFMSVIVALLVGLTISAEEIFRDQKILKREKFLHLSRLSYLCSKIILLFGISFLQSILFVLIGNVILEIRDNHFHFFLLLFSVFGFSNLLGLILSSSFNSPVTIYIIIPLIIIPQMLLGGAMFSYNKLNSLFGGGNRVPPAANLMVSRWAYEAIATDMFCSNAYEAPRFAIHQLESDLNYRLAYLLPKLEDLTSENASEEMQNTGKRILSQELTHAGSFGFKNNPAAGVATNIAGLIEFYNEKRQALEQISEKQGKAEEGINTASEKTRHVNSRLEEIMTGSMEKEKISIENGLAIRLIDPVYAYTEKNPPFLAAYKKIGRFNIPTYYFNLSVIWIFNLLLFVALYYDLLKKIIGRFF